MPLFSEFAQSHPHMVPAGAAAHRPAYAGEVAGVILGGAANRAGIRRGDLISAVNGHPVQDVIDMRFYAAEEQCVLTVHRGDVAMDVAVDKHIDEQIGLEFTDDLFDGIRLCANRCDFCFVDQQPKGMRETLGIRDDDFRLSFLHGNFVTLTNLSDYDWERIFRQKLSPLYISVHATDTGVRGRLLRNKQGHNIIEELRRLIAGGIRVHTQAVLCQNMNDGAVLDRTIEDLAGLHPDVVSLAVVPMGVTDYRLGRNESEPYAGPGAAAVLDQIRVWQRRFEPKLETRFVIPSDEFYLLAGRRFPRAHTYDGFPQLSNGVGGCRVFLDELAACRRRLPRERLTGRVQLVTGSLALPLIERFGEAVSEILGLETQVVEAVNNWYGRSTTVAGLVTGRDVTDALNKAGRADIAVVPEIMLREGTETFLDDRTVGEVSQVSGRRVMSVAPWPHPAIETLRDWAGAR